MKEIYRELTVDIVEFVFIFVDDEVFPVFLVNQGMAAVWTAQDILL